ncbi:hypothetical protein ISN44_As10g008830 [Arabidopsis suecica]|uniref:Glabrous enhancer-binding protein-like C-terminal domain-containing protein n=1 Tax=Arabidopsis suecica TaxID=45249 RepID=A0A8T1ZW24_ARASU|nr:hypothetical protein ISN44_As10g008830 [Arabidopsis suecica]
MGSSFLDLSEFFLLLSDQVSSDDPIEDRGRYRDFGVVESPVKSKKKKDESVVVKANGKEKKLESLVEEDKEVGILGGYSESSNWFEKSFLVRVVASLGVDECIVNWKWSKVSVETKKKIEEKMKLLEANEFELLS